MADVNKFTCKHKRKRKDKLNTLSNSGGIQDSLSKLVASKFSGEQSSDSTSDDEDAIQQFTEKIKSSKSTKVNKKSRTQGDDSNEDDRYIKSSEHDDDDDDDSGDALRESSSDDVEDEESVDERGDTSDDDADNVSVNSSSDEGNAANSSSGMCEDSKTEKLDKMDAIHEELMSLPFNELQKLKDKLGTKVFQQAVFGKKTTMSEHKKQVFKRANKNRPMEMSAKVPVARHRDVIVTKKKVHRDPRFDDLSGEFKEDVFQRSYGFLNDVKGRDLQKLKKQLIKEKDPEKKEQIKYLVNRMSQQEQVRKDKEKKVALNRTVKKMENKQVSSGKLPFFLKKSDRKTLELAEKFRELKKSGKVEQYLSKRRKKIASKDRKRLPTTD